MSDSWGRNASPFFLLYYTEGVISSPFSFPPTTINSRDKGIPSRNQTQCRRWSERHKEGRGWMMSSLDFALDKGEEEEILTTFW